MQPLVMMKPMVRMRMLGFCLLFSLLPLFGLTVTGQEKALELIHLHEPSTPSSPPPPMAVSVSREELPLVSSNVLAAEVWLKTHVLAYYPSTKITAIIVGNGTLCNKNHEQEWSLVLPSVKNLYHSLIRWGLLKEIKVSAAFSSDCFEASAAEGQLRPLLSFLQESSLPYTISPFPHSSPSPLKSLESLDFSWGRDTRVMKQVKPMTIMVSAHKNFLQKLGFFRIGDIRVMSRAEPMRRKLSSSKNLPPVPLKSPSPQALQFAPVPGSSFYFAPELAPSDVPVSSPVAPVESPLPFCFPPQDLVPAPSTGNQGEKVGLWCVAKPTVPDEKLQEGMDFACGKGGANCDEIRPDGNCFNPDNLVAHASYAFNSYWQKTKKNGGSCNFDDTAILINSDPSFLHCRFELN